MMVDEHQLILNEPKVGIHLLEPCVEMIYHQHSLDSGLFNQLLLLLLLGFVTIQKTTYKQNISLTFGMAAWQRQTLSDFSYYCMCHLGFDILH